MRSSIISFLLGIGLGWFLTTPTGRYAVALVLDAIRGRTATPVDDDTLTDRVRAALGADTATWHLPQPDVVVRGGVVTLSGEAPHDEGRLDLTSVAATVDGVVSVVDHLSVVDTTPASAPTPTPTA